VNKFLLSLVFALVLSLLLGSLPMDMASAQSNTQVFNKDKKMCYLVLSGGGANDKNEKAADSTAQNLSATLDFLRDQAKDGSVSRKKFVNDQKEFTDEINSLKNICKAGDEAVIFYIGHSNFDGEPVIIRDKEVKDVIEAKELKEILSGFEQGATVSFYHAGCFGDKINDEVEKAVDDKGTSYGANFNYFGAKPKTFLNEVIRGLQTPLSDEDKNKSPDAGNNDGVTTTDEYEESIKEKVPRWFISLAPLPEEDLGLVSCAPFPVGGELLPIDTTSLLLAGVQTNLTWIIPIALSVIGISVILVRKKF